MSSRIVIGVLMTALIGGAGAWVVVAQNVAEKPTRAEVKELILAHSPYVTDEALIGYELDQTSERLDRLEAKVEEALRGQAEIGAVLKALSKQLDSIEQKLDGR
jgi:hypothetical protein